jgi:alpha-galactosidase
VEDIVVRIVGENAWVIESGEGAYALSVRDGRLLQTYFGPRLPHPADYAAVPPMRVFGAESAFQCEPYAVLTGEGGVFTERTIDLVGASGIRGARLRFETAELAEDGVVVRLRDEAQGLAVNVHVRALGNSLFSQRLTLGNFGANRLHLERAFSGSVHLPARDSFTLEHLDGRWGDEYRKERHVMQPGVLVRESRRIITSHGGVPYFAVDEGHATEESGEVWFGTLKWSGNWKLMAEKTMDGRHIVHLGLNDHDFGWDLDPGETFAAPELVFGFTQGGHGAVSRHFHDHVRAVAPRKDYVPPVVYNSWYATLFDVDEAGQTALADIAAGMGVECFVMDDGWFSGRVNDRAGLGDWWPDAKKFPNGLKPLVDAVHGRGMKFGLWIEPEMVNPDSDLYRAHPDWILHHPGRDRTLLRNQSILNLARTDVQDYLIDIFDKLLGSTPIDFIKWDMNRSVSEAGWPDAPRDQREVWVRYVEGLYRLWGELRRRHPGVIWENCAGGGGRVDLAMMELTEQSWASDNTVPSARLQIQEGYSQLFPAATMAAWVTDEEKEKYPLDFRFHVSMAGALGVGGNLLEWTAAERDGARRHVERYKAIRPLVTHGDLYRLRSPQHSAVSALSYVAKDKSSAVVFAYRLRPGRILREVTIGLNGLDPDALYGIEGSERVMSGLAWANVGLRLDLHDDESVVLVLDRRG